MDEPRQRIEIRAFQGLVTDVDPHDREPGQAVDQLNFMSANRGELTTRRGYRPVRFEETA